MNLEVQKKDSWYKLGIHSSAEFQTFIQAYWGRGGKPASPNVNSIHDKHLIIHKEHLETIFSSNFTNFRIVVWIFPSSTNQS